MGNLCLQSKNKNKIECAYDEGWSSNAIFVLLDVEDGFEFQNFTISKYIP